MRRIPDEGDGEAVVGLLEHAERFPEAEVAHDVEGEVVAPVCHVLGRTPSILLVVSHRIRRGSAPEPIGEGSNVLQNVFLHRLHCRVGERMRKHPALPRMRMLIDTAVRIEGVLRRREGGVEDRLLDVGVEAVDGAEGRVAVYGQAVWAEAHEFALDEYERASLEIVGRGREECVILPYFS